MAGTLTIFAPSLAAAINGGDAGVLRMLFTRARHVSLAPEDPTLRQRRLLDPTAAVTDTLVELMREGDEVAADAPHWLRADPVCLQPDRATLRLFAFGSFELDATEADALIANLNAELGGPGWHLYRGRSPRRWYLGLDAPANATAPASDEVARGDYDRSLPAGADAMRQRRWLNDAQMVLHAAPSNAAREQRGALPVNSIWLWGGGEATQASPADSDLRSSPPQLVFAGDPLSRALAKRLGLTCLPLPDAENLLKELPARHGVHAVLILVPDSELTPSPLDYLASLVATLRALVRRGICRHVVVDTGRDRWTLGRFDALCFWRRGQPVLAHG